ncbi:9820_t:CDS:2, partial [Acaulospora colombiana]
RDDDDQENPDDLGLSLVERIHSHQHDTCQTETSQPKEDLLNESVAYN